MMPKIVTVSQFEQPNEFYEYSNYVNYMKRGEAQNNKDDFKYDVYAHYMFDEEKSQNMFNEHDNFMSKKAINKIKSDFSHAQKNKGMMWKDVISFDNSALESVGIYDSKTHTLDEQKIKEATRKMMKRFEKKEGLEDNLVWSGAIHYNTDNIHVHVAAVEKVIKRTRGKRKPATLKHMKSTFANELFDIKGERQKINEFIRERIVKGIRDESEPCKDKGMKKQIKKVHKFLEDIPRNQWNYNNNILKYIRPEIDKITDIYIKNYHSKDFEVFKNDLKRQTNLYKETYGENSNYGSYEKTKMKDLYARSGNTILKNIKELDQDLMKVKQQSTHSKSNATITKLKIGKCLNQALYRTKYALRSDYDKEKNIQQYYQEFDKQSYRER
ncbi:MobP2 family relaxase [Staphylococcus argenteus]